jgi:hypothetical protein
VTCAAGLTEDQSHPQQPLGVAGEDLGLVLVAQRHGLHPFGRRQVRHERPVHREQDAIVGVLFGMLTYRLVRKIKLFLDAVSYPVLGSFG